MRNNELRGPTAIDTDIIPSDSEHVFAQEALYQEAMMRYHCAILEMRTKLEVLSKDMTVRYRRNPIEFIESRLKKPSSIARKLKKMGLEVTVDNMTQHLSDIAGIRVLCAYIDDIYEIARMLARQKDVQDHHGEGLHQNAEGQRIQKLSPDCRNSGVFQRQGAAGAMRNSDPHDCNGLLGDARPRYAIQKAGGG